MKSNYYLEFENNFRGERKNIIEKLVIYDSLINLMTQLNGNLNFLDIGCGRGEWLEKWKFQFVDCIGIESDQSMVDFCRNLNLNIISEDALLALKNIPDISI